MWYMVVLKKPNLYKTASLKFQVNVEGQSQHAQFVVFFVFLLSFRTISHPFPRPLRPKFVEDYSQAKPPHVLQNHPSLSRLGPRPSHLITFTQTHTHTHIYVFNVYENEKQRLAIVLRKLCVTRRIIIGVGGLAFTVNGYDRALVLGHQLREHPKKESGDHTFTSQTFNFMSHSNMDLP